MKISSGRNCLDNIYFWLLIKTIFLQIDDHKAKKENGKADTRKKEVFSKFAKGTTEKSHHHHHPKKKHKGRKKQHGGHSSKQESFFSPDEANKKSLTKSTGGSTSTDSPLPTTTLDVTELPESTGDTQSPLFNKFTGVKNTPLMLPVTTEGKRDPLKVYGFPKELLPIMPGGGSRFEDVEREKLEKKKMSQTRGGDDDSAENGSSHEAESLYSSASLSSMSIAFYCLVSFLHLGRLSL